VSRARVMSYFCVNNCNMTLSNHNIIRLNRIILQFHLKGYEMNFVINSHLILQISICRFDVTNKWFNVSCIRNVC
jgi:hypothetical protein